MYTPWITYANNFELNGSPSLISPTRLIWNIEYDSLLRIGRTIRLDIRCDACFTRAIRPVFKTCRMDTRETKQKRRSWGKVSDVRWFGSHGQQILTYNRLNVARVFVELVNAIDVYI